MGEVEALLVSLAVLSCHGNGNCSCNHCPFYEKLDNFFKYFREIGGLKMRKILFRGKRIDNGEWVEGYLIQKGGETLIVRYPYCTG
ncbi:MAG: hypothetical protein U0M60_18530, partial [Clostridia bacterium]|nr:hypothetical protein [Clostridia bacterium]